MTYREQTFEPERCQRCPRPAEAHCARCGRLACHWHLFGGDTDRLCISCDAIFKRELEHGQVHETFFVYRAIVMVSAISSLIFIITGVPVVGTVIAAAGAFVWMGGKVFHSQSRRRRFVRGHRDRTTTSRPDDPETAAYERQLRRRQRRLIAITLLCIAIVGIAGVALVRWHRATKRDASRAQAPQVRHDLTRKGNAMESVRTSDATDWALLRLWHLEAMEAVIENPRVVTFTRTSYVTAPARWKQLPRDELASRVEQLLNASYRLRAAQLGGGDRMMPFAFYFEWVDHASTPANPEVHSDPWTFPVVHANPILLDIAVDELDKAVRAARPGIDARCYDDAFSVFRIDDNDSWHIVRAHDRPALFAARYPTASS